MASPSFGSLLRNQRLAAGLTQELLAERSGVAKRTLQDLELDATRPRRETVRRLIAALAPASDVRSQFEAATSAPRHRGHRATFLDTSAARHDPAADAAVPTARRLAPPLRQNLMPISLTTFIGREREVADLLVLLRANRLLTLTGPGGAGKTRLALELAARAQATYTGGVHVVSLAPLTDPRQVGSAIAEAFGSIGASGEIAVKSVTRVIGKSTVLLLLDNVEHLMPAGPLLLELLSACPMLAILVTSREALRLRGEQVYPVPSLTVPSDGARTAGDDAMATAMESEAVQLFVSRAQSAQPGFRLDSSNVMDVAEICIRLDGLPLAIELAAARIRHLTPTALRVRLTHRMHLLTGGAHDLPVRQRTLRDAIAWSYNLLSDSERQCFRRLGVFAGGFTLAAVDGVEGWGLGDGDEAESPNTQSRTHATLDLVSSLVEKSLVIPVQGVGDELRYRMLETIREFALEQLEASGEAGTARARCAAYFLALVENAGSRLLGSDAIAWLRRISVEHDNVRTALTWSRERLIPEAIGLRLIRIMIWYWSFRGSFDEGRGWIETMLMEADGSADRVTRARALYAAASLADCQGDYLTARSYARESAALYRAVGDLRGLGRSLSELGLAEMNAGDIASARATLEESLAVAQQVGNQRGIAFALGHLGSVAHVEGDVESARALFEASATTARDAEDHLALGIALVGLALTARQQGALAKAAAQFKEALVVSREVGVVRVTPRALAGLAGIAVLQASYERAARLFGAAAALQEEHGVRELPHWQMIFDGDLADLRNALEASDLQTAWSQGHCMSLGQIIAYALDEHTVT